MTDDLVLAVDDITVALRGRHGPSIDVLQNVSFSLRKGEVLGLIGESGAGKSMIGRAVMNMLPSLLEVASGRIRLAGRDITRMSAAERRAVLGKEIAFIPQDPQSALNPVLSIGAQFREHLARLGVRERWRKEALALLASVEISDPALVLEKYAHELSGGMCQRILIAMAFAARPAVIIADEATTALDPLTQAKVVELMQNLQRENRTAVVFITHDLRLAANVCSHILVLFAGQPLEYGPSADVMARPVHPYTRALKQSIPALEGDLVRLPALPDHAPSLRSFAETRGCRYAPRATVQLPVYEEPNPKPVHVGVDHWVRWADPNVLPARARAGGVHRGGGNAGEASSPLLEVRGVSKRFVQNRGLFAGSRAVLAAEDVSLTLREGEFLGIVGLSGSGKSTLARMIVGLEKPDGGEILLDGRGLGSDDPETTARRISSVQMVFQNSQSSLNPRRRIGDIVTQAFEGIGSGWSTGDRREVARSLIRGVGLPADVLDRFPRQLSGGQRQRVGIARALCVRPRVIVADEIVSGLDNSVQAQVLNLLLDLRESAGISLIFISHDLSVVRYLCDRTIVMRDGRIVEQGETESVLRRPQADYTKALIEAIPPEIVGGMDAALPASPA